MCCRQACASASCQKWQNKKPKLFKTPNTKVYQHDDENGDENDVLLGDDADATGEDDETIVELSLCDLRTVKHIL